VDDGCSSEIGGCALSEYQKWKDAQDAAMAKAERDKYRCAAGNRNYCSSWDNWAWNNLPSALIYTKGVYLQGGFGGEAGTFVEVNSVYNWRSWEYDKMSTVGHYFYVGTPQMLGMGGYKGVSFVYGASSNASIVGNSSGVGITGTLDEGASLSGTYQFSVAVDNRGVQLVDSVSKMPITSQTFSLGVGGNLFGNLADLGGFVSESTTQIGNPINPTANLFYQILSFIP
jgi:hypothetical protein